MAPPTPQQLRVLKVLDRALLVQGLLLIALLVIGSATEVRSTSPFGVEPVSLILAGASRLDT